MKTHILYPLLILLSTLSMALADDEAQVSLYFSPHGGSEATIVNTINSAELHIDVAAYSFSSKPIAKALYAATQRGVAVRVLLDRKQPTAHYSMANDLQINGLEIRIDRREPLMHMKTMILDGKILILGSYNFSAAAENRNAEIIAVIISKKTAAEATANWLKHWTHSMPHKATANPGTSKTQVASLTACKGNFCPLKPSRKLLRSRLRRTIQWY